MVTTLTDDPSRQSRAVRSRAPSGRSEFVRVAWVSQRARSTWEPRLRELAQLWQELEWRSVLAGIRNCALTVCQADQLIPQAAVWAEHGLNCLPISTQAMRQSYAVVTERAVLGAPFAYRVVLGSPAHVSAFMRAYNRDDNEAVADQLGFPSCCSGFFRRVWIDARHTDTTWHMRAQDGPTHGGSGEKAASASGPVECNIFWRWLGVRAVPHLPCGFACDDTARLGKSMMALGNELGHARQMECLTEVLSWPVEWSALHGIAEIKTPILRLSTRTDHTPARRVLRWDGGGQAREAATGSCFPFRRRNSHSTRRTGAATDRNWYFLDNGFSSREHMESAHRDIVDLVVSSLGGRGGPVLDLGCGNGVLLRKIRELLPDVIPFGIDTNHVAIEHARRLHKFHAEQFVVGDMCSDEAPWKGRRFSLVILMPGRLLECSPTQAARLRKLIREKSDLLVAYAYGDWAGTADVFSGLAQRARLELLNPTRNVALARCLPE